jgi:hypothetical protein
VWRNERSEGRRPKRSVVEELGKMCKGWSRALLSWANQLIAKIPKSYKDNDLRLQDQEECSHPVIFASMFYFYCLDSF